MKYTEFKNGLENGQVFPVYLFEGEDVFFSERGIALLKEKFLNEPALNLSEFNGTTDDAAAITDSLSAYPFMSEKRLTVAREFYPKKEDLDGLRPFLENPSEDMMFIVANTRSCEVFKRFPAVNVIDCSKADLSLLARWVKAECANSGIKIDLETSKLIAEYCQQDMMRIKNETEKLCAYAIDKGEITVSDVDEMVARDSEYKIYEMTDYIGRKNFEKALSVITDMLGKGEPPQKICTSIYNYFRRLLHVAISDKSDLELSVELGVKEYAVKKLKSQAGFFKKKALKNAVDTLTLGDFRVKSGAISGDEEMWIAVFKILTD